VEDDTMASILIVDDNENLRDLYEMELQEDGYEVTLASDGDDALKKVRLKKPDLIVLDIAMPNMDGIQCMRELLAEHKIIPVILHTAFAQYKDNYLTWPANAYIVKSGDLTELKDKIRELLDVFGASAEQQATGTIPV
jgi:DNA-binding response OmpR family regulator